MISIVLFSKICMRMHIHENSLLNICIYIVSIVHQILSCKICSKKNSEDQKSKKHPKHNGVENDEMKPFKCTELTDASPKS